MSPTHVASSRIHRILLILGALCLVVSPSLAQVEVRIGGKEGGNFSRFGGGDGLQASAPGQTGATLSRRPGFIIGGMVTLDPSGPVGLQTEALWIWKGSKVIAGDTHMTTKVNYLEFPVLAKYDTPVQWGPVTTHLVAGPTVAFTTGAQRDRTVTNLDGRRQVVGQTDLSSTMRDVELGVALGAEIGYHFSDSATLLLELRHRRGLTSAFSEPIGSQPSIPNARNQGLAVSLGFVYSSGWSFSL